MLPRCGGSMDSYTKHSLLAAGTGWLVGSQIQVDLFGAVALGIVLAILAHVMSKLEDQGWF